MTVSSAYLMIYAYDKYQADIFPCKERLKDLLLLLLLLLLRLYSQSLGSPVRIILLHSLLSSASSSLTPNPFRSSSMQSCHLLFGLPLPHYHLTHPLSHIRFLSSRYMPQPVHSRFSQLVPQFHHS